MRRGRKNKIRRERMIMIASSALVMGALTLTGVYMKNTMTEKEDDGYAVDFSALEDTVDDKLQEIEEARLEAGIQEDVGLAGIEEQLADASDILQNEDAMDYAPVEAGSGLVEIPGLTDNIVEESTQLEEDAAELLERVRGYETDDDEAPLDDDDDGDDGRGEKDGVGELTGAQEGDSKAAEGNSDSTAGTATAQAASVSLDYSEAEGLIRPVNGEVILPYSMESSIYFSTLDQYKYHPAVVLQAQEGDAVSVCADGQVVSVYEDAQIGQAAVVDLGNGYQVVYGQLKELAVAEGSYVTAGSVLGSVAAPTKYYTLEGPNLYFAMTRDGAPMDPELLFR